MAVPNKAESQEWISCLELVNEILLLMASFKSLSLGIYTKYEGTEPFYSKQWFPQPISMYLII